MKPLMNKSKPGDDNKDNQQPTTDETQTAPYDDGRKLEHPQGEEGEQTLREAAVKAVENQHGPNAKRSPNYDELVADAERQIQEANKNNNE